MYHVSPPTFVSFWQALGRGGTILKLSFDLTPTKDLFTGLISRMTHINVSYTSDLTQSYIATYISDFSQQ